MAAQVQGRDCFHPCFVCGRKRLQSYDEYGETNGTCVRRLVLEMTACRSCSNDLDQQKETDVKCRIFQNFTGLRHFFHIL